MSQENFEEKYPWKEIHSLRDKLHYLDKKKEFGEVDYVNNLLKSYKKRVFSIEELKIKLEEVVKGNFNYYANRVAQEKLYAINNDKEKALHPVRISKGSLKKILREEESKIWGEYVNSPEYKEEERKRWEEYDQELYEKYVNFL
jgi:hypothetical protein